VTAVIRSISLTQMPRTDSIGEADDQADIRTVRVKTVDVDPANPNRLEVERGDFDLSGGETLSLALRDLPTDRPLVLNLLLPASLSSAASLPVRIIALDGTKESKLARAMVADDRDEVRVQIERNWLSAGRYRIEIETSEPAQPALRHYRFELR